MNKKGRVSGVLGSWDFPDSLVGKESACNVGDPSPLPGLGRSPGEGKGYPLQYSGLENSVGYTVAKSRTRLSNFDTTEQLSLSFSVATALQKNTLFMGLSL